MAETSRMALTTDSVNMRGFFDPRYTCDFDNSSPELRWTDAPEETQEFVLIAEDPDAPGGLFTHWTVYHIPPHIRHLPAGIPAQETLPNGIRQGINSYNKLGYNGPCPPPGDRPHRYVFRLYALRQQIDLPNRATREQIMDAVLPHVLATAELSGMYERAIQRAG